MATPHSRTEAISIAQKPTYGGFPLEFTSPLVFRIHYSMSILLEHFLLHLQLIDYRGGKFTFIGFRSFFSVLFNGSNYFEKKCSYKFFSLNIVFAFFWKKDILKKKIVLLIVKLHSSAFKICELHNGINILFWYFQRF